MIFKRAQQAEEIGAQLVIEKGEVAALALCLDETSIYADSGSRVSDRTVLCQKNWNA